MCDCGQPEKIVVLVEGMTCGHCKAAVEKAAKTLPGVKDAQVNLEEKKLTLEAEPGSVTLAQLKEIIEEEGYTVIG